MLREDLIKKYNRPAPRYTSYPPVPYWKNNLSVKQWAGELQNRYDPEDGLDLYVHVPFCESLCYYCGCNRTITKDHSVEEKYLGLLLTEWEHYRQVLGGEVKINSLHLGGGTPTFLSPKNLSRLIQSLTTHRLGHFIGSIEVDPRTCTMEHLIVMKELGISRVSLGVQDFDPVVQEAIHRRQSPKLVGELMEKLRRLEFESVNFDLIYGLPLQTNESIRETVKIVSELGPDLLAFYAYAHLPERIKNQRLIKESDLPSPELKRGLFEIGRKLLLEAGYEEVGMDHFALPGNFLQRAKSERRLHRNFMGFVDKKSNLLLGLGPTAISDSGSALAQNAKEFKDYERLVTAGGLALEKGHLRSEQDLQVERIILDLMCQGETMLPKEIPFRAILREELQELEGDGLLKISDAHLKITPLGEGLVRNIALCFDFHHREKLGQVRFSQSV